MRQTRTGKDGTELNAMDSSNTRTTVSGSALLSMQMDSKNITTRRADTQRLEPRRGRKVKLQNPSQCGKQMQPQKNSGKRTQARTEMLDH